MALIDTWSWLVKLAAIVTASTVIWKYAIKPIVEFAKDTKNLIINLNIMYPILETIVHDFKPNGGNSLRDVVDRIELNLFLFEQKYRAVVEFQDIGVFETDKDGKYTWVSDKWLSITNQSWLDASNNGWIAQVAPEDRNNVWHEWESAVRQTRQFSMKYKIIDTLNGTTIVSSTAIPVKNKEGKVLAYLGKITSANQQSNSTGAGQFAG